MKLLLVEDDPDQQELMLIHLGDKCNVVTASDGADALKAIAESLKSEKFSVLVIDVAMLYIDGTAFIRAMRCLEDHEIYPRTSILLHTAHDDLVFTGEVLERLKIKPDDLYLKPNDTQRLVERLKGETSRMDT